MEAMLSMIHTHSHLQVGSCDVKFPIRLEGLVLTHSQFSSYEPELFPGLIYRSDISCMHALGIYDLLILILSISGW